MLLKTGVRHILLIVPPNITFEAFARPSPNVRRIRKKTGDYGSLTTDMPLGLLCLSAYLKKSLPVKVSLVDCNVELNRSDAFQFESFKDYFLQALSRSDLKDDPPDLIGISALFTSTFRNLIDLGECGRTAYPSAFIVAGGAVPTNMYREIYSESSCFDALCFGEGEKPLLGLLRAPDKKMFCEDDPSWITPGKLRRRIMPSHAFVEDLDEIPFCDYALCATQDYSRNPAITAYPGEKNKTDVFYTMTSRGCPHQCSFCSSHTVHGRRMRYYSVARVAQDLGRLHNDFGAKVLVFQDDHFLSNRDRAIKIIKIIKEAGITAVFANGLALYALDKELLGLLKSAGVSQLNLPIESGSERVLREIIHKPLSLPKISWVLDECRRLGIYTTVNAIIGFPGETKQDIAQTRAFLKTLPANWFTVFCANPLVGSELCDICKKDGKIKLKKTGSDYKTAIIETDEFSAEYIQEIEYLSNLELNFVHNNDMRLGEYESALKGLETAIRSRSDHVFAYHYAAQCYEKLGSAEKSKRYSAHANQLLQQSVFWRKYADMFKIAL